MHWKTGNRAARCDAKAADVEQENNTTRWAELKHLLALGCAWVLSFSSRHKNVWVRYFNKRPSRNKINIQPVDQQEDEEMGVKFQTSLY